MNWFLLFLSAWFGSPEVAKENVTVSFKIPALQVSPYHRPYVAVWVETEARDGVKTLIIWHEKEDWLKDLRQWWRKLGRNGEPSVDGISGATPKPGTYSVEWNGLDAEGKPLPPGTYYLNIEAVRENGGRDFHRQKVILGKKVAQNYTFAGDVELSDVVITIQ